MTQKIKKISMTIAMLCSITSLSQADSTERLYPLGCHPVGFSFSENQLHLFQTDNGQPQTIYLIHNASLDDLIIETTQATIIYLPHYKKTLPANHWTVFARSDAKVNFICKSRHTNTVYNCEDVLQLCNYDHAEFPTQNTGTYWFQKTTSDQADLIKSTIRSGILLR